MKINQLQRGSILSELSFYKVVAVSGSDVTVTDANNNQIVIGKDYVEQILDSADLFDTEEKKTMTELSEIFISSARIAMTVAFYKKDENKTKKQYDMEVQQAVSKVQSARTSDVEGLLKDLIVNPISRVIPGEFRVMKGRHLGVMNNLGRIEFFDMEDNKSFMKQVDPRTIQYLIVGGVKYTLKK